MRKLMMILLAGCMIGAPCMAGDMWAQRSSATGTQQEKDKKEVRRDKKEIRAAKREHYKQSTNHATMKQDREHVMRENYKQRRKMYKSSKKENRRGWDANHSGDVFGIDR